MGPEAGNDRVQELQRGPQLLEARGFEHQLSGCDDNTEAPVPVHDDLRPPEHLDHQAQPHAVPLPVPVEAVHPQETEVLIPPGGGHPARARPPVLRGARPVGGHQAAGGEGLRPRTLNVTQMTILYFL